MNEKKLQILNVAESLFAEKGFEGTSIRNIAKQAGVNIAMISYYFGSKDKLLQSLIKERMHETGMVLEDLNQNKTMTPWEKIDFIIDYYVDKMLKNRKYFIVLSRQLSLSKDDELTTILVAAKRRNVTMISEIIKEGREEGIFKKVNNELTIGTIIGTISQVSMSRPFYCELLGINLKDEEYYFSIMIPKLKNHLKYLLRSYLSL